MSSPRIPHRAPRLTRATPAAAPASSPVITADPGQATSRVTPPGAHKPNLVDHGGRVIKNPVLTPLYVGSYWNTPKGAAERSRENGFAKFIGKSGFTQVLKQYGVQGMSYGGSRTLGFNFGKKNQITDRQIVNLIAQQIGNKKPNPNAVYTVVLPPGVNLIDAYGDSSKKKQLGGYHGSFKLSGLKSPVLYAAVTTSTSTNGHPVNGSNVDNVTAIESHEWAEAATDPDVAWGKYTWLDTTKGLKWGGEIGDLTRDAFENTPYPKSYYPYARQNGYAEQLIWSKKDDQFEIAPKNG